MPSVTNAAWVQIGALTGKLVQNTGDVRIAYVFAANQAAADAIDVETEDHGVLNPGHAPIAVTNADNLYLRALGPKDGTYYIQP